MNLHWSCVVAILIGMILNASAHGRPLTVTDNIALQVLHEPCTENRQLVVYSPDRRYFFVFSTHGRLDVDRVEDSIRVYRTIDVDRFLNTLSSRSPPAPLWMIERSSNEGPVISGCRWTANSQGIAFLERSTDGDKTLMLAEISDRQVRALSLPGQSVGEFDIRDERRFVYRVPESEAASPGASTGPYVVVTGRDLASVLVPDDVRAHNKDEDAPVTAALWIATDGRPRQVVHVGAPVIVSNGSALGMALSPDGQEVSTAVPLERVPAEWEEAYPPASPEVPHRMHAGLQPRSFLGAHRYVLINVNSGVVAALTEGPTGFDAGWSSGNNTAWSKDAKRIALSAAYTGLAADHSQKPCVTVVDLESERRTCVAALLATSQKGYFMPFAVNFTGSDSRHIEVSVWDEHEGWKSLDFIEDRLGHWGPTESQGPKRVTRISIEENPNRPPRLIADRGGAARIVWDPNPWLKDIDLGEVSVYHWLDHEGHQWMGGLYKPVEYRRGQRYPLVIQTHGFDKKQFNPSGWFTTANAAQTLAGSGIMVLQVPDQALCHLKEAEELKCAAGGYDAAVQKLGQEGDVDPDRVGLEGFSWTCLYVTEALAFGQTKYRAASLVDGVMQSYMTYLTVMDNDGDWPSWADRMFGQPFGSNLESWVRNSSVFALSQSSAAVQVIGLNRASLLYMWEPYAILHYLHKPVDALLLNTNEHVLTNPAMRLASQGGEADWFRFWLKGEEDQASEKREQYLRWHALRDPAVPGSASQRDGGLGEGR